MPEFNLLAVLVAALAAFVLSSAYYAVFASQLSVAGTEASDGTKPPPWKLAAVEFLRSLILATVVAGLGARCSIEAWSGGLLLGLALWVGFPLVLWSGAVIWEGTRLRVAALHLGDWLTKLLAVAAIVCAWRWGGPGQYRGG